MGLGLLLSRALPCIDLPSLERELPTESKGWYLKSANIFS